MFDLVWPTGIGRRGLRWRRHGSMISNPGRVRSRNDMAQINSKRRFGLAALCRVHVACSRREPKALIENKREYVATRATYRAGDIIAKSLKSWCRVEDLNP